MENKEVVEGEGVVRRWERGVFHPFFFFYFAVLSEVKDGMCYSVECIYC